MATWCFLSGMIRRLKSGQQIVDSVRKVHSSSQLLRSWKHEVTTLNKRCCVTSTNIQFRYLHTSGCCQGKKLPKGVPQKKKPLKTSKGIKLDRVYVHESMTISEIALAMKKSTDHVYEVLFLIPGTEAYDHDDAVLDENTIVSIVKKSGMIPQYVTRKTNKEEKDADLERQPPPDPKVLVKRPPVVTIMGHVDHGKTTLLDKLRQSNIVDQEFGGITQHIGAFLVTLKSGETICFLDTPGHAAFSAMRSRGAQLTDIIVLVVAADDGVMHQTIESIHHAQNAGVPIIVAINKVDKDNADVNRTKQMLLEHQIQLEEFGGDVQAVPISALKGINIDELQEAIVTQAELMNLQGDPVGLVEGRIVEARLDDKRGRLVTAVIQRGTLKRGDLIIAGTAWGKVRAMFDDAGRPVQAATPGTPVEILGWKETPSAGEEILQVKKESELKAVLAWRRSQQVKKKQQEDAVVIEEKRDEHDREYKAALVERRQQGFHKARRDGQRSKETPDGIDEPQYALVLKGDVDGSVDAILDTLDTYNSKMCQLDIIHFGVGSVSESDVEMAAMFDGDVYAFNVQVPDKVKALATAKGVQIKRHNIIYRLFEDLISGLNNKLPKVQEDVSIGEAKVLQVFQVSLPNKKKSYVAGCRCIQGTVSKKFGVKVVRNDETIYRGSIVSLKHFRDEVDSIKKEEECGIGLDDPDLVFQPQDIIVCFTIKEIDQEIDWNPGF